MPADDTTALSRAEARVGARLGFYWHAGAYCLAICLMCLLNYWQTPHNLWVGWVALGWGCGLALHGAWALGGRGVGPLYRLEGWASTTAGFWLHAACFALVMAGLTVLNLWQSPDEVWVGWVALAWGCGLAAHGGRVMGGGRGQRHGRMIRRELERMGVREPGE